MAQENVIASQIVDDPANVKLSIRQRIDYAVSEFGYNAIYYWISGMMMFFFTDMIKVAPAMVAACTLWVRLFDGVNDPIIGSIADRSHSKWGRYKPWVGIGAVFMSAFIFILFCARPGWSSGFKTGYMWAIYTAVTVASTCCNMPFGALNGVLTSSANERAKLSGMRMLFASIGINFFQIATPPLLRFFSKFNAPADLAPGAYTPSGFTWSVLFIICLGLPTLIWSAVKVKEVVKPPKDQTKIPLGKQLAGFFTNKYAIIGALGFFMFGFLMYGGGALNIYYFVYVAGDRGLYSYVGIAGLIAAFIGSGFLAPRMYRLLLNKARVIQFFFALAIIFYAPLYIVPARTAGGALHPLFWICQLLAAACRSGGIAMSYSVVPDATDMGEFKTGVRTDGFIASFVSLMMKAGGAVGPAVLVALIAAFGYVPGQAQNETVLKVLRAGISIIPAACCFMILILYLPYDLNDKRHEEIRQELAKRR
jgi:sugar (glycoside-pentoside-hexuronide) transporter